MAHDGVKPGMLGELGPGATLRLDGDWRPGATAASARHGEETERGMASISVNTRRMTHGWAFAPSWASQASCTRGTGAGHYTRGCSGTMLWSDIDRRQRGTWSTVMLTDTEVPVGGGWCRGKR
jgi:hypothetical protein